MFDFSGYDSHLLDLVKKANCSFDTELEIRFGDSVKRDVFSPKVPANENTKPLNWNFKPTVSLTNFDHILNIFETYPLRREKIQSVDTFYKMSSTPSRTPTLQGRPQQPLVIRHTLSQDVTGNITSSWMSKRRYPPLDLWNVNMRIALSSEILQQRRAAPHQSPCNVRRKDRTSFFDKCVRYDFTVVNSENYEQGPVKRDQTFEIEIEYLPELISHASSRFCSSSNVPLELLEQHVQHIKKCAMHVLRLLYESPVVATLTEKHNILLEYNTVSQLTIPSNEGQKARFIGAQPEKSSSTTFTHHQQNRNL